MKCTGFVRLALLALALPVVAQAAEPAEDFRMRANARALQAISADDVRVEIEFGRDVAARVLARHALLEDERLNRYVNLVGKTLAAHSTRPELEYRFGVIGGDFANAYSAPGGYVFVTRGALLAMQDEAELAAVLAHEIAHVSQRHIVKALNLQAHESGGATGMAQMLGMKGGTARAAFQQAVDEAVEMLFEQGYRQQDELEADLVALLNLAAAGYDPAALGRYLGRIEAQEPASMTGERSTHPPSEERRAAITSVSEEEGLSALQLARARDRFEAHVKKD